MDDATQKVYDVDRNGFDVNLEQLRPPPGGNTVEQIAWIDALMVEAALMAFSMDTHRNNAMHTFNEHYKKLSSDNGDIEPEEKPIPEKKPIPENKPITDVITEKGFVLG